MQKSKKMQILLSEPFAELSYIEDGNYFCNKWYGFLKLELVKPYMVRLIEIIKNQNAGTQPVNKIFIDITKSELLTPDLQEYFADANIQVKDAGIKYYSVVIPKNVFAQFTLEVYLEDNSMEGIKHRTFGDELEALTWLKSL